MSNSMGPMIFGMSLSAFLMAASGIFYLICVLLILKPYLKEKNELMGALIAFLVYQAVNMFFMGVQMHTMNMVYGNIASLSVFLGSAYMLKFPLSSFSEKTRKLSFILSMLIALGIFSWFMQDSMHQMKLMHFTLWYDLVVNGLVVGGSILALGFLTTERLHKIKALGGGTGVVTCCIASNGAMLSGALIMSSFFGFLAPVFILGSLIIARKQLA